MNPLIQFKTTIVPIVTALTLACFALLPRAQAVVPPPDGGYPGGNTAEGQSALLSLNTSTGSYNTGVGFFSLRSDVEGDFNTGIGAGTLFANTSFQNTATGAGALLSNTTGFNNSANGAFALFSNTLGSNNTAAGAFALFSNIAGGSNTATGQGALSNNTFGNENTAIGASALASNTTGQFNTALGFLAGLNVTTATNVICIGSAGADVNDSCFIGNIFNRTSTEGTAVFINSDGQLGTIPSSCRFKDEIKPMNKASEAILGLKPVTFRYNKEIDSKGIPQFGLVAEDVEKVNPDLVARDKEGKPYSVRYEAVNAMLLNEFLKEHRKVEQLEKQIDALTAGLQRVSAELELSKPAPQTVLNSQ